MECDCLSSVTEDEFLVYHLAPGSGVAEFLLAWMPPLLY